MARVRRHPLTGEILRPLGYRRDGRAIWPILGGDDTVPPNPLERLNELVGRGWENLNDEEFAEAHGILDSERQAIQAADTVDPTHVGRVADLAVAMRAESDRRAQVVTTAASDLDRLNGAFDAPPTGDGTPADPAAAQGGSPTGDPAAPAAGDPSAAAAPATPAAPAPAAAAAPAAPAPAAAPEPVAASTGAPAVPVRPVPLAALVHAGNGAHTDPAPAGPQGIVAALTASAGSRQGQNIAGSRDEQIEMMAGVFGDAIRDLRVMHVRNGTRIPVVASRWSNAGPRLSGDEGAWESNRRAMDQVYEATPKIDPLSRAVVASGGICRPVTVDYNVPTWSNVAEPAKASLSSIDAPRGGLQYGLPVPYVASDYDEGVGIWSEPNDADPAGADTGPLSNPTGTGPTSKTCVEIDCSQFAEVDVEAIWRCATATNFRSRFSPENMNVLLTYLEQAFVSLAEKERIKQMRANATHNSSAAVFGASRDIFNFLDKIRAYYRSRYRLSDSIPLRVGLMSYVRELIRIDLRNAAFPFEWDSANSFDVTDAQIDALLATKGITPVWYLDDDTGDQTFLAAAAGTEVSPVAFPTFPPGTAGGSVRVRALAYPEGAFQRLDGGELNLGVVRDSVLNSQNKFQIFAEIFEAVAFRGFEATDWTIDVLASGATAGTTTPVGYR